MSFSRKGLAQGKLCSNASSIDKNKTSVADRAKKIKMPLKDNSTTCGATRKGLMRRPLCTTTSSTDLSSSSSSCSTNINSGTGVTSYTVSANTARNAKVKNTKQILSSTMNRTKPINQIGPSFSDISRIDTLGTSRYKESIQTPNNKYNDAQWTIYNCEYWQSQLLECQMNAANKESDARVKADIHAIWSDNLSLEAKLAEKERQLECLTSADRIDKSVNYEEEFEKVTSQLPEVMEKYTTLSVGLAATLDRYPMDGFTPPQDPIKHADSVCHELNETENLLDELNKYSEQSGSKMVDLSSIVNDLNEASSAQSNSIARYMNLSKDHEAKVLSETSMSLQLFLKDR